MSLSSDQVEAFKRDGFVVVEKVFSQDTIQQLRADVARIFQVVHRQRAHPRDTVHHRFDIYNRYPSIGWLLYHPPITAVFRDLVGEDYYTPQENMVAQKGFYSPWHKDTDYYEILGSRVHFQERFLVVNIAIYLQDNDAEQGGGLDIIPGSHHYMTEVTPETMGVIDEVYLAENPSYSVPIQAGSIVLFDQRTYHRATVPQVDRTQIVPEKMAIFWAVCANNELISEYYEIMKNLYGYKVRDSLNFMMQSARLNRQTD